MVANLGRSALIGIVDAFRLIPINPGDFELLGFSADGLSYIAKCIPMACSISCKIWKLLQLFNKGLHSFMLGLNTVDHFLDDFVFAGRCCSQKYAILMSTFVT